MSPQVMKCGHSANATTADGKPACAICVGIRPGAEEIDDRPADLTGRSARCVYGPHGEQPSSYELAFFEHRPSEPQDRYYCGCYGWD